MTGRQPVVGDLSICFPRARAHAAGALLSNWGNELAVIDLARLLPAILPSQYSTVLSFHLDIATDQHVSEYNRYI